MSLASFPSVTLSQPPRIPFRAGCATDAVAALARAGHRRIFVVTSPSLVPRAESFAEKLRGAGATVEIAASVPPEPTTGACEYLRAHARQFAPDLVLGLGGGSV